jgi:Smg protein
MKESVLDVLMYLFDHYIEQDHDYRPDQDALRFHLQEAGFEDRQVSKAFDWLEDLSTQKDQPDTIRLVNSDSLRVYNSAEQNKLSVECRSLILFLEQTGVLDAKDREFVIERVMALETDEIDLQQLKWVVLMVLLNQPGKEAAYAWMEDVVMDDACLNLH